MPMYFGGYYPSYYKELLPFKHSIPVSILDTHNQKIAKEIQKEPVPVGVHVRRGDMSVSQHNWKVCPTEYFINGIKYFINKYPNAAFYFFSDEPYWVKENILPLLSGITNKLILVECNGSDKGYMDLALLSYCHHFIASQGSLAHYANMLCQRQEKIMIVPLKAGESEIKPAVNLSDVNPRPVI